MNNNQEVFKTTAGVLVRDVFRYAGRHQWTTGLGPVPGHLHPGVSEGAEVNV